MYGTPWRLWADILPMGSYGAKNWGLGRSRVCLALWSCMAINYGVLVTRRERNAFLVPSRYRVRSGFGPDSVRGRFGNGKNKRPWIRIRLISHCRSFTRLESEMGASLVNLGCFPIKLCGFDMNLDGLLALLANGIHMRWRRWKQHYLSTTNQEA